MFFRILVSYCGISINSQLVKNGHFLHQIFVINGISHTTPVRTYETRCSLGMTIVFESQSPGLQNVRQKCVYGREGRSAFAISDVR